MAKNQKGSKYVSREAALTKLQKYCAYQERSHQEVRSKLLDLNIYGDDLEEIISKLISDNFLNEERFARAFARGKFRLKQWGRRRIKQELKRHEVSDYSIRKAMEEIDNEDYMNTLRDVIRKKSKTAAAESEFEFQNKLAQYAIGRGFEAELVWEVVRDLRELGSE